MTLGFSAAQILSPVLAGLLVERVGVKGVVLVDGGTFLFSLVTLLLVRFPRPEATEEGKVVGGSLLREARLGWTFIRQRPGLLALLLLFACTNFCMGILLVLVQPLVLSFASAEVLGVVLSLGGFGMLAGSLVMSLGGGPRRRVRAILLALLTQGLLLFLGGLRPSAVLVTTAAFVFLFASPIIDGCSQVIWQSKVAPDLQGRVFAVRRMVAMSMMPLAFLAAGPLADHVFEPLLLPGGALADTVGQVVGVGKGRGIGLLFVVLGTLVLTVLAIAARYPRLVRLETELPDAIGE
jgi:DHA3 family macrolide efflux protein-like MFS transporter